MISYREALEVAQTALIARGYPAEIEHGGGGLYYVTAKLSPLNGRNRQIMVAGWAYVGIELQIEGDEGEFEAEPWCPVFEFTELEGDGVERHLYTGVTKTVHEFLDEVEAL